MKKIPVGVSGRHVHLSQANLETLFGAGYELKPLKDLSQPGHYAAQETVAVSTEKGEFKMVRILGPVRKQTQVEISLADAVKLGLNPPVRDSGDLKNSPGLAIAGPKGSVAIPEGVICAARHIHMNPEDAEQLGVKDKDLVSVKVEGERGAILNNVLCRVGDSFQLELHCDTDEGNAVMLKTGDKVSVLK